MNEQTKPGQENDDFPEPSPEDLALWRDPIELERWSAIRRPRDERELVELGIAEDLTGLVILELGSGIGPQRLRDVLVSRRAIYNSIDVSGWAKYFDHQESHTRGNIWEWRRYYQEHSFDIVLMRGVPLTERPDSAVRADFLSDAIDLLQETSGSLICSWPIPKKGSTRLVRLTRQNLRQKGLAQIFTVELIPITWYEEDPGANYAIKIVRR